MTILITSNITKTLSITNICAFTYYDLQITMNTNVTIKNQFFSHRNVQLEQFSQKMMTSSKFKN